jgi:hypothetical protein
VLDVLTRCQRPLRILTRNSFQEEEEEEEEKERSLIKDFKRHAQLAAAWSRHGSPVPRWCRDRKRINCVQGSHPSDGEFASRGIGVQLRVHVPVCWQE